ncbi:MAG: 2-oxoacid:ferredoxin oxidoreductase subunit beta [Firmicutes bacterium]|nr:2-oxoacid:ferredoxin oxidoreductase subunit beta [Candidatus Fermentithermobacillaceae bacterium]
MGSDLTKYLRVEKLPHIWCAGCGHGIVTQAIVRAIDELGLDPAKVTIVSGIGCSSRAPGYMNFDTLHTTHGRAIAFATGVKLARPELKVIVITGDGDAAAIGGNHLIHAARRNIDLTVVCYNNSIYGMTSGQYSPVTPLGSFASTAPYGMVERPFDLCELVMGAGGTFVARSTTYHARHLTNVIKQAIQHKGFSFVDALSQCPTYFGRRNNMKDALAMLNWYKENAVSRDDWAKMPPAERGSKFPIGVFRDEEAPEYCETYRKVIEKAMEEVGAK